MKTSIVEIGGLLSVLSARGVEKQLSKLPGVERVEVNYVASSATVVYDWASPVPCGSRCASVWQSCRRRTGASSTGWQ